MKSMKDMKDSEGISGLRPLYTELAKTDWGRTMAMDIYRRARPTYHSVAVNTIDKVLNWGGQK